MSKLSKKKCGWCKKNVALKFFGPHSSSVDGYQYQCRPCRAAYEDKRRRAAGITKKLRRPMLPAHLKMCLECKKNLRLDKFSPASRGYRGLQAFCRKCFSKKYRYDPAIGAAIMRKWRKENVVKWRLKHRNHQHARRARMFKTSSGRIPYGTLVRVVETEICFYCERKTKVKNRTVDHKIPLSCGGAHLADNLVMACSNCNFRKGKKTEEEFRDVLCKNSR